MCGYITWWGLCYWFGHIWLSGGYFPRGSLTTGVEIYRLWQCIDGGAVLPGQKCIPYIAGGIILMRENMLLGRGAHMLWRAGIQEGCIY